MTAIEVRDLHKSYGTHSVLRGVSFTADAGSVLCILGPNGAGKTTTIDILTTRRLPDSGTVRMLGRDVVRERDAVVRDIAVAQQEAAVDTFLTGRENLVLCGRMMRLGKADALRRADELLTQFGLAEAARRPAGEYSGGMRRRLDLAMCLPASPKVIFLDEPTTGLDTSSRAKLWAAVNELAAAGTTIVLSTQYLEEADALADQIVIINRGVVVASGNPRQLKQQVGDERVEVQVERPAVAAATAALRAAGCRDVALDEHEALISVRVDGGAAGLLLVAEVLHRAQVTVGGLALRQPTMDEVFLALTGRNEERARNGTRIAG